jgi:hypothetical protein
MDQHNLKCQVISKINAELHSDVMKQMKETQELYR